MDVEFEEVEECIIYELDSAVNVLLDAKEKFEWSARLVACWERYVGQLSRFVGNVFTCVTANDVRQDTSNASKSSTYTVRLRQLTGIVSPTL
jgi:hypothetical protein